MDGFSTEITSVRLELRVLVCPPSTGSDWHDTGHAFTRPDGHLIEPATLTRQFNALLRDADLRPVRLHDLRHSTATLLLEQGVELVVIKELLGPVGYSLQLPGIR